MTVGARPRLNVGPIELNSTCRPYHLGWILEAWSDRPAAASDGGTRDDRPAHRRRGPTSSGSRSTRSTHVGNIGPRVRRSSRMGRQCSTSCSTRPRSSCIDRDERLREIIRSCALVNADGSSVVWASRILGQPLPERVAGIDLFVAILERAATTGHSVYFLGATDEVLGELLARIEQRYPTLRSQGRAMATGPTTHEVIDACACSTTRFPVSRHPQPAQGVLAQRAPRRSSASRS